VKKRQIFTLILLLIFPIVVGACETEEPTQPTPIPAVDIPSLSPSDAIGIAQEHSVSSPVNVWEKQAGIFARQGGTKGWSAQYVGNGKWTVEFRVRESDDSIIIHRWSVFESSITAVYLGAFAG
jgi:hypothetical protein